MKADRLLSILLLLQAKGQVTGRELARRLEVSLRTVHRDMEALSAAGVPVFARRGARGGWQLDEGWRTRVPALDAAELHALLMAQPRMVGDSRLARAAQRALEKLMAALPASLRGEAASIQKRLLVDTTGWSGSVEDLSMLPIVQEAVSRDRRLAMHYWPRGRDARERVVDPLGLVAKGTAWYLVARTPDGLRTYRVSRIESARILDEGFERPADFDLPAHWRAATEEVRRGRERYQATLRVAPEVAASFQRWRTLGPAGAPDAAGWVTLTMPFDDEAQAAFVVLGHGPDVEVVGPERLRHRVAQAVADAFARTRGGSAGDAPPPRGRPTGSGPGTRSSRGPSRRRRRPRWRWGRSSRRATSWGSRGCSAGAGSSCRCRRGRGSRGRGWCCR
jgi:predicted DNA-binding transcriptional regulator YafY